MEQAHAERAELAVRALRTVLSYASSFTSGEAGIVLVNKGTSSQITSIEIENFIPGERYYYYVLKVEMAVTFRERCW